MNISRKTHVPTSPATERRRGRGETRRGVTAYISVMVSGRLVGISVRLLPLQSTMLLLHMQESGHCRTLQDEDSW